MKRLLLFGVFALLAGCGSTAAPVKPAPQPVPVATHYPPVVDQNGNPVVNSPYPLPPAPPQ